MNNSTSLASIFINLLKNCWHITLIIIILPTAENYAQSDNYWSWNFNTPSTLLAGSVVGGGAGPSAVFYNPSLIDHEDTPSISLSASIVSLQLFKFENIAGEGVNADKINVKVQPRFLSYNLPSKSENIGMEVAILSPVSEEMEYTIQYSDVKEIIARTLGPELYSGYLQYYRKYDETWVGFGVSYKIGDNIYLGASSFIGINVLKYRFQLLSQAFQENDSVIADQNLEPRYIAQNSFEEELSFWDAAIIFKAGAQYKSNNQRFSIGINFTMPDIPLFGDGNVRKALNRSNVYDNSQDSFTSNEIYIGVEESISPRVKHPFSASIGFLYFAKERKNAISFTMEYFHSIAPYAVVKSSINSKLVPGFSDGLFDSNDFLSYYNEAKSVINMAIGFKQYVTSTFFVLGGFRTDFTSGTSDNIRFQDDKFRISQVHMDKYHFTLGPTVTFKRMNVVTGLQYSFGKNNNMLQVINFSDPVEYIPQTNQALQGLRRENARASIDEFAFFLGMTLDLIKK